MTHGKDREQLAKKEALLDKEFAKRQDINKKLKELGYDEKGGKTSETVVALNREQAEFNTKAAWDLYILQESHTKNAYAGKRAEIERTYQEELLALEKVQSEKGLDVTISVNAAKSKREYGLKDINEEETKKTAEDNKKIAEDAAKAQQESQKKIYDNWKTEAQAAASTKVELIRAEGNKLKTAMAEAQKSWADEQLTLNEAAANGEDITQRKINSWVKYVSAVKNATNESIKAQRDEQKNQLEASKTKIDAIKQEIEAQKSKEMSGVGFSSLQGIWQKSMEVGAKQRYAGESTTGVAETTMLDKSAQITELKKQNTLLEKIVMKLDAQLQQGGGVLV